MGRSDWHLVAMVTNGLWSYSHKWFGFIYAIYTHMM